MLERTGSKLKYIRITGLELEGDGSDLKNGMMPVWVVLMPAGILPVAVVSYVVLIN